MRWGFALWICLAAPVIAQDARPVEDHFREVTQMAATYDCRDVSCKRLSSCEEACYKLIQCGQSKRDGDNDGIPCENLCKKRCP